MNNDTRANTSGRLFGRYRAIVVSNTHPDKLHLAKVRLLALWEGVPDSDLPWAEYHLPLGASPGEGDAMPVKPGDNVWVEFPYAGDSRMPLITGSAYMAPAGESHLPADLFEQTYQHKRSDAAPAGPEAAYGDKVSDLFGVLQQLTQGGDWCITHKASGTSVHITKDGHLVFNCETDHFRTTGGNVLEEVKGKLTIKVNGDAEVTASNIKADANSIKLNGGAGVVTGAHICQYTGSPHSDCSSTVSAGK